MHKRYTDKYRRSYYDAINACEELELEVDENADPRDEPAIDTLLEWESSRDDHKVLWHDDGSVTVEWGAA